MANNESTPRPSKLLAEWFWTDRWIGSSAFLLPLEPRGLYREMLTQAWRRGGSLPNDHESIRRAVGCTLAEWRRCWPKIERYWRVDGDNLINETQAEVYASTQAVQEQYSSRGKKGAQARWKQCLSNAQALNKHVLEECTPSPSPDLLSQRAGREGAHTHAGAEEKKPSQAESFDISERAGVFCEWYADTHLRLIGVGYLGNPRGDYEAALRLAGKFTDEELRRAAVVWFGMEDDFATRGTRTIPKFASRASECVLIARKVVA